MRGRALGLAVLHRVADQVLEQRDEQRRRRRRRSAAAPRTISASAATIAVVEGGQRPVERACRCRPARSSRSCGRPARRRAGRRSAPACAWRRRRRRRCTAWPCRRAGRRTAARAAGRSSPPCAAVRTGRARRRRRTARGRRWSARAPRCARASSARAQFDPRELARDARPHRVDVARRARRSRAARSASMRLSIAPPATSRVCAASASTGSSTWRCSPRHRTYLRRGSRPRRRRCATMQKTIDRVALAHGGVADGGDGAGQARRTRLRIRSKAALPARSFASVAGFHAPGADLRDVRLRGRWSARRPPAGRTRRGDRSSSGRPLTSVRSRRSSAFSATEYWMYGRRKTAVPAEHVAAHAGLLVDHVREQRPGSPCRRAPSDR